MGVHREDLAPLPFIPSHQGRGALKEVFFQAKFNESQIPLFCGGEGRKIFCFFLSPFDGGATIYTLPLMGEGEGGGALKDFFSRQNLMSRRFRRPCSRDGKKRFFSPLPL